MPKLLNGDDDDDDDLLGSHAKDILNRNSSRSSQKPRFRVKELVLAKSEKPETSSSYIV